MKSTKKRVLYVLAALLAALFVLSCLVGFAACGGGSTEDDGDTGNQGGDIATISSVTVNPSTLSLTSEGATGNITASVTMSSGSYSGSYTWASDDATESVIKLTSTSNTATVTAVATGTANVTVSVGEGTGAKTATCAVTVTISEETPGENTPSEPEVSKVELDNSTLGLNVWDNKTGTLTATVTMTEGNYSGEYAWTSSDTTVATVSGDATATVTALKAGSTTITVSAGGVTSSACTVTVTDSTVSTKAGLSSVLEKGGSVALTEDIEVTDSALEVKADTTIDLAGKSISTDENLDSAMNTIEVAEGKTLTITDSSSDEKGTISNTYTGASGNTSLDNAAAIESKGTLVIESGTIESSSIGIKAEGGTVTIDGGTIESEYFALWEGGGSVDVVINDGTISGTNKGIVLCGDSNYGYTDANGNNAYQTGVKTTLTINGGEISCEKDSAITTLGVGSNESVEITITGGTITGAEDVVYTDEFNATVKTTYPAIYLPTGTLTITGGTITGITAVEVRGGIVNISGGELVTSYFDADDDDQDGDDAETKKAGVISNSSGATSYGYSLAIYPYGGTSRAEYQPSDNAVKVTVTAGIFSGDVYVAKEAAYAVNNSKWSVDFEGTGTEDTPSYYVVLINESLGFTSKAYKSDGTETSSGDESYYIYSVTVTKAGDESALSQALTSGGEIVLTDDITIGTSTSEGSETTALKVSADTEIDLAGKTLTTGDILSSALNTIEVSANATLTIIDSTGDGTISNTYTGTSGNTSLDNAAAISVAEGGTLVIESGAIESSSVGVRAEGVTENSDSRATVVVDGGEISSTYFTIWASGDADVTINGGTIEGTNKGICIGGDSNFGYSSYQSNTKTTLTITDGEISCTNDSAITTLGVGSNESAVITISGGTITGAATPVYDEDNTTVKTTFPAIYLPTGTLTITGGTITGITAVEIRGGKVTISGGELVSSYTGTPGVISNSSGATSYGYSLAIYPYGGTSRTNYQASDNAVNVSVTDGTFSGDIYVAAEAAYAVNGSKWQVAFEASTEEGEEQYYLVVISGDAITVTTEKYDASGNKIEESTESGEQGSGETQTVAYYIISVIANVSTGTGD